MNKFSSLLSLAIVTFAAGLPASAMPLKLTHAPLFLSQSVEPNLAMTFDDSGSMARGFMPNEIAALNGVPNGNGGNLGRPIDGSQTRGNWFEPWATWHVYNTTYYNPNINYILPVKADGTQFADVSFTAARDDGFNEGSGTRNLGNNYRINWGCCNNDGPNVIRDRGSVEADGYRFPFRNQQRNAAFYHTFSGDRTNPAELIDTSNYTAVRVSTLSADEQLNFARWYSFYRTRLLTAKSGVMLSFANVTAPIRVTWQGLNNNRFGNGTAIRSLAGTQRNNFWTYLDSTWQAGGGTPVRRATQRAGDYFTRTGNTETNPYWDVGLSRELSCRQNYHVTVTDGGWNSSGGITAGSGAADDQEARDFRLPDGQYYSDTATGDPSPGDSYGETQIQVGDLNSHTRVYWNESNNNEEGFGDDAFYYWATDLRPDLTNNVPPFVTDLTTGVTGPAVTSLPSDPLEIEEIYFNPANNPATWQHMVHFNVGLGVEGAIPLTDEALLALRTGQLPDGTAVQWPSWGAANSDASPGKIDDNWHAALNSRGQYFSARRPDELVTELSRVLNAIISRNASASAVAVSSGVVTTAAQSFQTSFNSGNWTGTVRSVAVNSLIGGGQPEILWDAGCNLTGGICESNPNTLTFQDPTGRKIFAATPSGTLVEFIAANLGSLSTAAQNSLNGADGLGAQRVNYLRGDRSNETANGGTFRDRASVLGDIINSGAVFVQGAASSYGTLSRFFKSDDPERLASQNVGGDTLTGQALYNAFVEQVNLNRGAQVLAGANDGMLHSFNGETGTERWAFIPTPVQQNLGELTDPRYVKRSYVDAGPSVRDAFINGTWRTVAVNGLRLGGQGFFALDISAPNNPTLLWEFTDADDSDLGFTYGEPFITRVDDGDKWVALLPSGYNSDEADANTGTGEGALYVVDLATGTLLKKFSSAEFGQAVNGLGPAVAGDYFSDGIADMAVAGDLDGNVWRFDLQGPASTWTVDKMYQPDTVGDQPITTRPTLATRTVDGALVAVVGTGKYIEASDRVSAGVSTQVMLGIFDRSPNAAVPGSFPARRNEMSRVTLDVSGDNRLFDQSPAIDPNQDEGWFIELDLPGERIVTVAGYRRSSNRVVFSTLIPAGADPCLSGGNGFILSANVDDGGPPTSFAPFDFNADGKIDLDDFTSVGGEGAGVRVEGLVAGITPVVQAGGGQSVGLIGGDTNSPPVIEPAFEWTRRGWRQLFIEE